MRFQTCVNGNGQQKGTFFFFGFQMGSCSLNLFSKVLVVPFDFLMGVLGRANEHIRPIYLNGILCQASYGLGFRREIFLKRKINNFLLCCIKMKMKKKYFSPFFFL